MQPPPSSQYHQPGPPPAMNGGYQQQYNAPPPPLTGGYPSSSAPPMQQQQGTSNVVGASSPLHSHPQAPPRVHLGGTPPPPSSSSMTTTTTGFGGGAQTSSSYAQPPRQPQQYPPSSMGQPPMQQQQQQQQQQNFQTGPPTAATMGGISQNSRYPNPTPQTTTTTTTHGYQHQQGNVGGGGGARTYPQYPGTTSAPQQQQTQYGGQPQQQPQHYSHGMPSSGYNPPQAPHSLNQGFQQYGPQPTPQSAASKIDPSQIPRPPHDSHADRTIFDTRNPQTGAPMHPPGATTNYMARDVGNANPRFIRSTTSAIPNQSDLLQTSGMPLAVFVNPLATLKNDEVQVPIVDNGGMGPVRCLRCKAYVNPGMRWVDHFRFACNFCAHVSECPREYACAIGSDGKRQDWMQRPELCRGSVEYMAPEEYMVRAPMRPSYFFVIDASPSAVQSGVTVSACEVISRTLDSIQGGDAASVGIATFDGTVHFYAIRGDEELNNASNENQENVNPSTSNGATKTPKMLIVPDVDDPYAPLPKDLLVNLNRNKEAIKTLLKQIPEMFANSRPSAVASGAAIKSAIDALKYKGGKIMLFLGSMCSGGWGKLEVRTHSGNVEKEPLKIMKPAEKCYQDCATEAAEYQIGIDIFVCGSQPVDLATIGVLTRTTGGTLYRYPNFNVQLDFAQLLNDLRWNFLRPQGMEAVMRVRASQGLGVAEYGGYFCKRTPTDVDLPVLDGEKSIMVNLRYEDKLVDGAEAYVQCALLYTTMSGERRIRVHTLALPVTSALGTLFRNADLDAQTSFMVRKAANTLLGGKHTIAAAKDAALAQCVSSLYAYRKYCASNNASGQLILPEALKTLPLYTIGMYKSNGLRTEASADDRAHWLFRMLKSDPSETTPSVYPRLFPLHFILEDDGFQANQKQRLENGDQAASSTDSFPPFPPCQWLSAEKLDGDGLYLLEDGAEMLVWVGRNYPQDRLKEVFGVDTVDQLDARQSMLPPNLPNERNKRMNAFINAMRKARSGYLRMRILKRNDAMETLFYNRLIEDRSVAGMSYVEFLCHVHRLIQNKFT